MSVQLQHWRKKKGLSAQLATLFIFLLWCSNATSGTVSARQVRSVEHASDGVNVTYSAEARFAANDPKYKTVQVKHSPQTTLKRAVKPKTPAQVAVEATVVGAVLAGGWVIDELQDQVKVTESSSDSGSTSLADRHSEGYKYCIGTLSEPCGSTPSAAVHNWMSGYGLTATNVSFSESGSNIYGWWVRSDIGYQGPVLVSKQTCNGSTSGDCAPPPAAEVPESEWWPVVYNALKAINPELAREFWNSVNGMPEMTPELQAELDTWAQQLEAETGEQMASAESTTSSSPQDVSDVRVDESGVTADATTVKEQYDGGGFDGLTPFLTPADPPSLVDVPDLPKSSSCRTIKMTGLAGPFEFPGEEGCSALTSAKDMLGWLLYILTFWVCMEIFLNRKST